MTGAEMLLEAVNLRKAYRRGGTVFSRESNGTRFTAVDNVSFSVEWCETFAVVGVSGCGKTTLALMLLRLIEPAPSPSFISESAALTFNFRLSTSFPPR